MSAADFCYRLISTSLIIARFSAVAKGIGLYAGWLICKYSTDDLQAYSLQTATTAVVNLSTALTTTEYSTTNAGSWEGKSDSC